MWGAMISIFGGLGDKPSSKTWRGPWKLGDALPGHPAGGWAGASGVVLPPPMHAGTQGMAGNPPALLPRLACASTPFRLAPTSNLFPCPRRSPPHPCIPVQDAAAFQEEQGQCRSGFGLWAGSQPHGRPGLPCWHHGRPRPGGTGGRPAHRHSHRSPAGAALGRRAPPMDARPTPALVSGRLAGGTSAARRSVKQLVPLLRRRGPLRARPGVLESRIPRFLGAPCVWWEPPSPTQRQGPALGSNTPFSTL